ncbi:MAG: hypothetical protein O9346_14460 [Leptospiraceae bacterium]|jgi:hypothetical protein|nr:hypothetical protein [Leptospiraceae bacterium]MCZ8347615.1 hypothetical protein [Leptospiraceae bacterium]
MTKEEKWKELVERKSDFQHILRVLNRYYENRESSAQLGQSHFFRKRLTEESENNFKIFIKKFGNYEYLIHAEIHAAKQSMEKETWIHIDGISEEREQLEKQGITEHPLFSIIGVGDLFQESTKDSNRKDLPK